MNRVTAMIERQAKRCADRLEQGIITKEQVEKLHGELDMSLSEYCRFQELKSLAVASGRISLEEAQTIYGFLGNTVEHFNKQNVSVKATLTQIFSELLERVAA
jgi:pantothenate kinase